ncbi:MAG TPA: thioredoxin family protein [Thermomicrobiales bacterium]|nr:thioredoxin family protein [Thermomicrobiales bacterium]
MTIGTGHVLPVADETFEQRVSGAGTPVLVEFGAPWCPPCRAMAPIIEQVGQEFQGRLIVASVDTDEAPRVAASLGVMGLPTFVLYQGGAPVERFVGFQPKAKLLAKIMPHLA